MPCDTEALPWGDRWKKAEMPRGGAAWCCSGAPQTPFFWGRVYARNRAFQPLVHRAPYQAGWELAEMMELESAMEDNMGRA